MREGFNLQWKSEYTANVKRASVNFQITKAKRMRSMRMIRAKAI